MSSRRIDELSNNRLSLLQNFVDSFDLFSKGSKKYDYAYKIFEDNVEDYSKKNVEFSNSTDQSIKGCPFIEILKFDVATKLHVIYSNFIKGKYDELHNRITVDRSEDLQYVLSPGDQYNDKRIWMVDLMVFYSTNDELPGDDVIQIPLKRTPMIKINLNKITTIDLINSINSPYNHLHVKRTNIWVYYPSTTVYLLIKQNTTDNEYGFSVYAMQTITRKAYPMTIDILPRLGELLTDPLIVGPNNVLPPDWSFTHVVLNSDTYMNVVSLGSGIIINDSLRNSYNYVDPRFCRFIYDL